jgi:hypothetical protein
MQNLAKNTSRVPVFIAEGIQKQLKTYAKTRKVSLTELVEAILSEHATQPELLDRTYLRLVGVPDRSRAVPRRTGARWKNEKPVLTSRSEDFEKLKAANEYPGTDLDIDCEKLEKQFLLDWVAFSDSEKVELVASKKVRADIYEKWKIMHASLVDQIASTESRLALQSGRAYRMTNVRLRNLRAQLSEFEAKVRWNLRSNLKTL